MKKFFYLALFTLFLAGCTDEYKPNGIIPNEDDPVEDIFYEYIEDMQADVKLEFLNDSCRSISASYGDNDEIFYQLILVNRDEIDVKNCLEEKIMPLFEEFKKVKKNKDGFYAYASDDDYEIATWYEHEYIFLMKAKKDYIDLAVQYSYFLNFR